MLVRELQKETISQFQKRAILTRLHSISFTLSNRNKEMPSLQQAFSPPEIRATRAELESRQSLKSLKAVSNI